MLEYELPVLVKPGKGVDCACASWFTELFTGSATKIFLIVTRRMLWEGVRRVYLLLLQSIKERIHLLHIIVPSVSDHKRITTDVFFSIQILLGK